MLTDKGEMNDILEEAGVKSVSISTCNHNLWWHFQLFLSFTNLFYYQKKTQKRKFKDDNFDDDMDVEPQLQYKGMIHDITRLFMKL